MIDEYSDFTPKMLLTGNNIGLGVVNECNMTPLTSFNTSQVTSTQTQKH